MKGDEVGSTEEGRLRVARRLLRLSLLLMDGRGHALEYFRHIWEQEGITSKKTVYRDMLALERIPELALVKYRKDDTTYWRATAKDLGPDHPAVQLRMKECTKCGDEKPVEEFTKDARYKDGRRGICLLCNAKRRKAWVAKNRKAFNAWRRKQYHSSEKRKQERNEERRARYALKKAKERGERTDKDKTGSEAGTGSTGLPSASA